MGKDPNLTPDNLTYYPNLYQFSFLPVPSNASDTAWIMTAEDESIFSTNADGNWTAAKAGETIVTVTNTAEEASIKIKVEVVDTVYPGILKADYDAAEAATDFDWDFDAYTTDENKATDAERMFARLGQWNVVMNKTTSNPDGDDHNQKIFYLGDPDRPYGIDLECHIDASTGVNAGSSIAMIWTKAALPAGVQSIQMKVGNNNKDFAQFRAVMVKEDGTVYSLTDGWHTMGADGGGTVYSFRIPDDCKGSTVAIAVEASLTKAGENAEIMVKGVWIELPIQSVAFVAAQKTVSQGSTVDLAVTVTPTKVIDDSMDYAVTKSPAGGEGKLTVDEKGKVTIAKDASDGGGAEKRNGNVNVWFAKNITVEKDAKTLSLSVTGGAKSKLAMYVDGKYIVIYDWTQSKNVKEQTYDLAQICKDNGIDTLAGKNVTFVFEVRDNANNDNGNDQDYYLDYFRISQAD